MASVCKLLINAVTSNKPKMLCRKAIGLHQKVSDPEQGLKTTLSQTLRSPAERQGLTRLATCVERVKPVVLPSGTASRKASLWGCG